MADDNVRERARLAEVIEESVDLYWNDMEDGEIRTALRDVRDATLSAVLAELRAEMSRHGVVGKTYASFQRAIARIEKLKAGAP